MSVELFAIMLLIAWYLVTTYYLSKTLYIIHYPGTVTVGMSLAIISNSYLTIYYPVYFVMNIAFWTAVALVTYLVGTLTEREYN
jgi:hypothetical protein